MKRLIKIKDKGLTMLELLVAMAIFSIVITIVVSLFMTALKGYRKNLALQNIQDNARFLLDFIAKELRMATINSGTSSSLNITRSDGTAVTYSFGGGNLTRTTSETSGPINSEKIIVNGSFYVSGITGGDELQPKVTIALKIEDQGTKPQERAAINIQVTLSQRDLDI